MTTIVVDSLTREFDGIPAVDHISFTVEAGEIFGFLGPNGAGKSTTIRMLTGQLRPTSGSAQVAGCDIVSQRDQMKPQIGVVFDCHNLYERMTARDNLRFAARLYRANGHRVDETLELVGLAGQAKQRTKSFSNGMKQRLVIARALLHQPKVLFMDEPTRGLDPHIAREIRALIRQLADQGMTIFLTTHYMEEADQLCRRVAFVDRGRMAALDTPAGHKAAHQAAYGGEAPTLEDLFVKLTGRYLRGGER